MDKALAIPRIIHQTWKTRDLPADYAHYHETVCDQHPAWDHWLWTDEDNRRFIAEQHAWFLPTYDSYKHSIERVDAVRYFILSTYGGVYLDLDMECLKPIDLLLIDDMPHFSLLALPSIENTIIGNAFMASPRNHPLFAYLCKRLPYIRERDVTHADVFKNTGPNMLTKHLQFLGQIFEYRIIGLDQVCCRGVLDQNPAMNGKSLDQIRAQKLLYLIHHHTNVWNIQHPSPGSPIGGYELFVGCDIAGFDIDYVEYGPGAYQTIADVCNRNDDAVGFNYNGYIKGAGGKLTRCQSEHQWLKKGIVTWICIKKDKLHLITCEQDP
ncbi:MAG: hypothetical protein H6975_07350 [Gammaproteobacteria bacterium]|nr:hypothetical protein [Gammaproteobacteria bacterium]